MVYRSIIKIENNSINGNYNSNILVPTTVEDHNKIKIEADYDEGDVKIDYSEYTKNSDFNAIETPTNKISGHKCTDCNQFFSKISKLTSHRKTHFENEQKHDSFSHVKIETDVIDGDTFKSIDNTETNNFPSTEKLNSHCSQFQTATYETHDAYGTAAPTNKMFAKICTVCPNEPFINISKLKKHMKTHIKVNTISYKLNLRNRFTVNTIENFHCTICNKFNSDMSRIEKHMETHTGEKEGFFNKSTVDISYIEKEFDCTICAKCFPTLTMLNTHLRMVHGQTNNTFSDALSSRRQIVHLDAAKRKEHEVGQYSYSTNEQAENSLGHIKIETDVADGNNAFGSASTKEYNTTSSFETCIVVHDKNKIEAVIADDDGTSCSDGSNVNNTHLNPDHVTSVNNESTKTCALCNRSFVKKSLLRKHMNTHMADGPWSGKNHSAKHGSSVDTEKKYGCVECGKRFTTSWTKKVHIRIFHAEKKVYRCNMCSKTFSDVLYLRRHKKYHDEKLHQCEVCQKSFPAVSSLKKHKRVHTGERQWKCEACERSYKDITSFKKHMQHHKEGYLFKCNECNCILKRRNCPQNHRCVPENRMKNKYKCDICEKNYTTSYNLKRHLALHTGEKQFICDICKKSFATKTHMKRHITVIHLQEKKYKCHTCNKCFSDLYYFKVHKTLHGNSKPYGCKYCKKSFTHNKFLAIHLRNHKLRKECTMCKTLRSHKKWLEIHQKLHHSN